MKMVARYGLNKNGAVPAWRCYGYTRSDTNSESCIDDWGELTSCSDPIGDDGVYCGKTLEIEALITESIGKAHSEDDLQRCVGLLGTC